MAPKQHALAAALILAGCAPGLDPSATQSASIVNGTLDLNDPAVVYLSLDNQYECSGTLISPRVVLTARHCLENVGSAQAFFGTWIDRTGEWRNVTDILLHPQGPNDDFDVALLTLDQPGPATPIPPNYADLSQFIGQPVRVAGFGVTSENGTQSGEKRQGSTELDGVDVTTMAAGAMGTNTCYGDSGGPNLMMIGGQELLVGVTSYGTTTCGMPSDISARVDYYRIWIQQYLAQHDPSAADGGMLPPPPDAGPPPPPPDAGFADSGVWPDSGMVAMIDAGSNPPAPDGGASPDQDASQSGRGAASQRSGGGGGCSCEATTARSDRHAMSIFLLAFLIGARRRRR